ncbi:MAG: carbohydrate-binding protein [Methylococcales bacterium]|nr:carbohydrate-binding protein [Methylococcales bacterium]
MSDIIQLLTVENSASRSKRPARQHMSFLLLVANLAYQKQVDIVWSGNDGVWRTLPAKYLTDRGDGHEYWQAGITLCGEADAPLPGVIRFAARLRCLDQEYWDNNQDENYTCLPNTGVMLAWPLAVQNLSFDRTLADGQHWLNLKIAVNNWFAAENVVVHWTTDNWLHVHQAHCRPGRQGRRSSTRIWTARLHAGEAFRLQYAICCENPLQEVWDNNAGQDYVLSRRPLKVLILNLHCYQEDRQDEKFSLIARVIDEQAVDVVCFQEVAEHWNDGQGDWLSNAAHIINQRLSQPFNLYTDWSHIGFGRYREGVAILSRHALLDSQSRYVSDNADIHSIHSRKVVMVGIDPPYMGPVNIFSAHLSWWEDGFREQFQRLCEWADSLRTTAPGATLLCGDFNITAGSAGYRQVVEANRYDDQYLAVNAQGLFENIFRIDDPHWRDYPADDYRIDYIFMNRDSTLRAVAARVLFTEWDYGQVSDHCGYLMTFEPQ